MNTHTPESDVTEKLGSQIPTQWHYAFTYPVELQKIQQYRIERPYSEEGGRLAVEGGQNIKCFSHEGSGF